MNDGKNLNEEKNLEEEMAMDEEEMKEQPKVVCNVQASLPVLLYKVTEILTCLYPKACAGAHCYNLHSYSVLPTLRIFAFLSLSYALFYARPFLP